MQLGDVVFYFPLGASVLALVYVWYLASYVKKMDPGNERMREIGGLIREGAFAFMRREYTVVSYLIVVMAVLLYFSPLLNGEELLWQMPVAFIFGTICSGCAGWIGMNTATLANTRTAQAAHKSMGRALDVAFSGGATMGMAVVGMVLFGLTITYKFLGLHAIDAYSMGASIIALFARVGGGIYTKGADMGADLVGKVEANIPEDDPRNPAVIADNVGDNVGDVAGLGADLEESYIASTISGMVLIAGILHIGNITEDIAQKLIALPLLIAASGIIACIAAAFFVKMTVEGKPQKALMNGTYVAAALTGIATFFIVQQLNVTSEALNIVNPLGPFFAVLSGLFAGVAVGFTSEYYTSNHFKPVKQLAEACQSGPAITVTTGLALGMESTFLPVIVLSLAILVSYKMAGLYGISLAALGMLSFTGMTVAVDAYGPVADNAGGIAEMAKLDPKVREITDHLDAVGNTTAAIGKGFAIGSAAFASMGLFAAYTQVSGLTENVHLVSIVNPVVVVGLFIGGMLPYLFSALLIKGVSEAAYGMIQEVRRQFKEIPGLLEGTALPDSARCVDISTRVSLRTMVLPGVIAVASPLLMGYLMGTAALGGFLVGALVTGLQIAIQCGNSGGAMDNAKKYIEEGHFGGKGTPTHAAAVVGDTVGDPLKDTVGPSIDILIKLMSIIAVVFAAVFPALPFFM